MLHVLLVTALWLATGIVLVPVLVFFIECVVGALAGLRRDIPAAWRRPSVVVLVPAHDEEAGIAATVGAILPQLAAGDRLIVIADNCTDATAAVARGAGAAVVERSDQQRRGKGYALEYGISSLDADPPEVVIVIDADCDIAEGTVDALARTACASGRPAQCIDVLAPPAMPRMRDQISALAFTVKNVARPAGLAALGMPCLLMGTGMALPWELAKTRSLGAGSIVEDMELGVQLAIAGKPAVFCPAGEVRGRLPQGDAALRQRQRWEHGHLQTLIRFVPRLLLGGLAQRRMDLAALAIDLAIPPLSLLCASWAFVMVAAFAAWYIDGLAAPALALAGAGLLLGIAVIAAWARFARKCLPFRSLVAVPLYVVWKLPLYFAFLWRRERNWVRTDRGTPT